MGGGCLTYLRRSKLESQRRQGQGHGLQPHVICQPSKPAENEKLPLIGAHSNIGNGLINDLSLPVISSVMTSRTQVLFDFGAESVQSQFVYNVSCFNNMLAAFMDDVMGKGKSVVGKFEPQHRFVGCADE